MEKKKVYFKEIYEHLTRFGCADLSKGHFVKAVCKGDDDFTWYDTEAVEFYADHIDIGVNMDDSTLDDQRYHDGCMENFQSKYFSIVEISEDEYNDVKCMAAAWKAKYDAIQAEYKKLADSFKIVLSEKEY